MSKESKASYIFQIAYDESLLITRNELLKSRGYKVVSAFGNDEAERLLKKSQSYSLFIVGHATSTEKREEMLR